MALLPDNVIQLAPQRQARAPRYTAGIAAEGWMEISERARRLLAFAEGELTTSWAAGDARRLRQLVRVHEDAREILEQGRRHAARADAASTCADGKAEIGHGAAA